MIIGYLLFGGYKELSESLSCSVIQLFSCCINSRTE